MNWSIEWTDALGRHHYKAFSNEDTIERMRQILDEDDCVEIVIQYIGSEDE